MKEPDICCRGADTFAVFKSSLPMNILGMKKWLPISLYIEKQYICDSIEDRLDRCSGICLPSFASVHDWSLKETSGEGWEGEKEDKVVNIDDIS